MRVAVVVSMRRRERGRGATSKRAKRVARSGFRKTPVRIHAAMQDADNLNGILGNPPIENDVASGAGFAIARPDVATVLPC